MRFYFNNHWKCNTLDNFELFTLAWYKWEVTKQNNSPKDELSLYIILFGFGFTFIFNK